MRPFISVDPNESLADEDVRIRISGLQGYQNVTVYALIDRPDVGAFDSSANYTASREGVVDFACQASLGGSYTGIEPMGLFWSMKQAPTNKRRSNRLIVRDFDKPVETSLHVFNSHLNYEDLSKCNEAIATVAGIKRWYKSPGVTRKPVRWKRIRGALFVPEGIGPFPALISIMGSVGGLMEHRASLLASRGYMALALAYFDYEDLPELVGESRVDLGYFEEAKEFLQSQPECKQNGIGIVGSSLGGMVAVACTTYVPGFKCAVSINGPVFTYASELFYQGRTWNRTLLNSYHLYEADNAFVTKYGLDEHYNVATLGKSLIEFADCSKNFLFLFGKDDNCLNAVKAATFVNEYTKQGTGKYKIVTYPGAGHVIEPPHFPHAKCSYMHKWSVYQSWGGDPKRHARAQELAWMEIKAFLKECLTEKTSKL